MILSPREIEILRFVAEGETQPGIAELLNVSYETVNYHVDRFKFKLEAKNVANAVAIAIRKKIIV